MNTKNDTHTMYIVFRGDSTVGTLRTAKGVVKNADGTARTWDESKGAVQYGRWDQPVAFGGVLCDRAAALRVIRGGRS